MDFTLPKISAANVVMWKCHVYDSNKGKYEMILGIDIWTELGLTLKLSDHVIDADDGNFRVSISPMVY